MTIPAALIIGLSIGVPVALLALSIAYRTLVSSRQTAAATAAATALAAEEAEAERQMDGLLTELQGAVEEMREQLSLQRESLAALMSDAAQALTAADAEDEQDIEQADDLDAIASRIADAELPAVYANIELEQSAFAQDEQESFATAAAITAETEANTAETEPISIQSQPAALAEVSPLTPALLPSPEQPMDTRTKVLEMLGTGLTDRQVARRLRIGVEEVRLIAGLPTKTTRKRAS